MNNKGSSTEKKLHQFMFTLLYPAVLGTMVVGVIFSVTEGRLTSDGKFFWPAFLWAVFLICYFSSQHVENSNGESSYKKMMFLFDVIEVALIMTLFLLLNIYDFPYSVVSGCTSAWSWFFILLIIAFLVPVASRKSVAKKIFIKNEGRGKTIHSFIAAALTISGFFLAESYYWIIILALAVVFISYLRYLVFNVEIPKFIKKIFNIETS